MNLRDSLLVVGMASCALACNTNHTVGSRAPAVERDAAPAVPPPPGPDAAPDVLPPPPVAEGGAPDGPPANNPDTAECPPLQATAAEIAASPRADEDIEMLALWISKRLVAPQATYDRLARDVPLIKQKAPAYAAWGFLIPFSGTSLMMQVTQQTLQQMRNGTFEAWKCPNRTYNAIPERFNLSNFADFIVLTFKGRLNEFLLAEEYGRMPGVRSAQHNGITSINPSWQTICATGEGDTFHYVFLDSAGGKGQYGASAYFTVSAGGAVTAVATHDGGTRDRPNPAPRPAWLDKYVTPNACYLPG